MTLGVIQCTSWSIVLSYCHGKKFGLPIVVAENNRKQLSEKAITTHTMVKTSGKQLVTISCSISKPTVSMRGSH
jgi:hypothetical protein